MSVAQPHVFRRGLIFIRFSHTVFAMPFALGAMLVAANGRPSPRVGGLIVIAMVLARTAAMTFNRLADWQIDQRNPRTEGRHRLISHLAARCLFVASAGAFIGTTALINTACLALSPVALGVVCFYSLTKRFTHYTQLFLGAALGVAPAGAWLAVTGRLAWPPVVLALGVICWVAGFDLIYATQDYEFDKAAGLRSLVVKFGIPASLRLAQWLHGAAFLFFIGFGLAGRLGPFYYGGLALILGAFFCEHRSAASLDVGAVNRAFFRANAFVGAVFVAVILADRLWPS